MNRAWLRVNLPVALWLASFLVFISGDQVAGRASGGAGLAIVLGVVGGLLLGSAVTVWLAFQKKSLSLRFALVAATFATCLCALGMQPTLDDDLYRYLWDGYVGAEGERPILETPAHSPLSFDYPAELYTQISYPDVTSVYPPVAQTLFRWCWQLFGSWMVGWHIVWGLGTLLCVLLLYRLLDLSAAPVWWRVLILFNPVFYKAFADGLHVDLFAILLIAGGWLMVLRSSSRARTETVVLGAAFGLATLIKPQAILLLPLTPGMTLRKLASALGLSGCVAGFVCLMSFSSTTEWNAYLAGLGFFSRHWVFNPFLAELLAAPSSMARSYHVLPMVHLGSVLVFVLYWLVAIWLRLPMQRHASHMLGLFLVTQPVINPWYTFWLWPLLCVARPGPVGIGWIALPLAATLASVGYWIDLQDIALVRWGCWGLWTILMLGLILAQKKPHLLQRWGFAISRD